MHTTLRRPFNLTLLIFAAACAGDSGPPLAQPTIDTLPGGAVSVVSPGPTAWTDTNGWRLVEAGGIRAESGEPGELITPMSIAVDPAGRVYVSDRSPAVIKVYDSAGALVRTIGREGAGPGEHKSAFIAVQGHLLALHDPAQSRTSLFDTAGTHLRTWTSACCYYMAIGFDRDWRITVAIPGDRRSGRLQRLVRYDTLGTAIDTLQVALPPDGKSWTVGDPKRSMMSRGIPFMPELVRSLDPAGGVLLGWSGDYRLVKSRTGRDTARVFGRAWTAEPVSEERRNGSVAAAIADAGPSWDPIELRNAFKVSDIPATLPAFQGADVDRDGNVWVRTDADSGYTNFDVFDSTGVYLGPVVAGDLLPRWGRTAWGPGVLYASMEDANGTPEIRRYRVVRPAR